MHPPEASTQRTLDEIFRKVVIAGPQQLDMVHRNSPRLIIRRTVVGETLGCATTLTSCSRFFMGDPERHSLRPVLRSQLGSLFARRLPRQSPHQGSQRRMSPHLFAWSCCHRRRRRPIRVGTCRERFWHRRSDVELRTGNGRRGWLIERDLCGTGGGGHGRPLSSRRSAALAKTR